MREFKPHITIEDIRSKRPCYDPSRYLPENWSGTLIDILDIQECSVSDRLWVVIRFLNDAQNRMFAVCCVRQRMMLVDNPDPRSLSAIEVAEKFALGEASHNELNAAWVAAWNAARDAARDAAWNAANAARDAQIDLLKSLIKDDMRGNK